MGVLERQAQGPPCCVLGLCLKFCVCVPCLFVTAKGQKEGQEVLAQSYPYFVHVGPCCFEFVFCALCESFVRFILGWSLTNPMVKRIGGMMIN